MIPTPYNSMEYMLWVGLTIITVSMLSVFIANVVSKSNEKTYRRMKNRTQRDRNTRHIAEIEAELNRIQERVSRLEN
jgi:HAMP domain-containing protein